METEHLRIAFHLYLYILTFAINYGLQKRFYKKYIY